MPSQATCNGKTLDRIWQECQSERISVVARNNGLTQQQLIALLQQSGHIEGANRDPSRLEIRKACKELQSRWTEAEAKARWVGARVLRRA